jgi:hypothetical protein
VRADSTVVPVEERFVSNSHHDRLSGFFSIDSTLQVVISLEDNDELLLYPLQGVPQ